LTAFAAVQSASSVPEAEPQATMNRSSNAWPGTICARAVWVLIAKATTAPSAPSDFPLLQFNVMISTPLRFIYPS
jgi:hypothetical protein